MKKIGVIALVVLLALLMAFASGCSTSDKGGASSSSSGKESSSSSSNGKESSSASSSSQENIDEIIKKCCNDYEKYIRSGKESDLRKCIPSSMISDFKKFYADNQNEFTEAELLSQASTVLNRYGVKIDTGETVFAPIMYPMYDYYEDLSCDGLNAIFVLSYDGQKEKINTSSKGLQYYLNLTTANRDFTDGKMAKLILSHIKEAYKVTLTEYNLPWGDEVITAFLIKYDNEWMLINIEGSELSD